MAEHVVVNSILPGDLVFDIGANQGDKALWFTERGVSVVCVEPQPAMQKILNDRFSAVPLVTIVGKAVGAASGVMEMKICSQMPVLSTLSDHWSKGRFSGVNWDKSIDVDVVTLDHLVATYGTPRYCKIDVEGFELEVISGLSSRVGIISYEFTSEFINQSYMVLEHLIKIGYRKFNYSVGESEGFASPQWMTFFDLIQNLTVAIGQDPGLWGDIYAN